MSTTAIIQARMGSTRLPGKVMLPVSGHPMLWHVVQRVRATAGIEQVVIATGSDPENDPIRAFCELNDVAVFSGSEDDVLDRYYGAAREFGADPVMRVTSDCPLFDPATNARLLSLYAEGHFDHVGVATGGGAVVAGVNGYPTGQGGECFSFAALERAWREATEAPDREHVTPYLWRNRTMFRCGTVTAPTDWSALRLTVDEPEDLELVRAIYAALYVEGAPPFSFERTLEFLGAQPELLELNSSLNGHEKYRDLWETLRPDAAAENEGPTRP